MKLANNFPSTRPHLAVKVMRPLHQCGQRTRHCLQRMLVTSMLTLATATVQAASFDCAKASSPIETYICLDYRVSDLDTEMGKAYTHALESAGDESVKLREGQTRWLKERNRCKSPECLINAYRDRLRTLGWRFAPAEGSSGAPATPWDFLLPEQLDGYNINDLLRQQDSDAIVVQAFRPSLIHRGITASFKYFDLLTGREVTDPAQVAHSSDGKTRAPPVKRIPRLGGSFTDAQRVGSLFLRSDGSTFLGLCRNRSTGIGLYQDPVPGPHPTRLLVGAQIKPNELSGGVDCDQDEDLPNIEASVLVTKWAAKDAVYVSGRNERWLIRLDENLWTESKLLGRKIFLGWEADWAKLVSRRCTELFDDRCVHVELKRAIDRAATQIH